MKYKLTALLSTLLFVGACSTRPTLTYDLHYWAEKGKYIVACKIPNSDFYAKASSSKSEYSALEKAYEKVNELSKTGFTNSDFEKVDNGDRIVSSKELRKLILMLSD